MFAGAGGGALDSGVSDRQLGTWLTFLQERPRGIYVVATCNDVTRLLKVSSGAFARAERFDAMFFMDLPGREQKDLIWPIYLKYYQIENPDQPRPDDSKMTGAEIKSVCRLAKLLKLSLVDAAKCVVPIAVTAQEQIEGLRDWAHHRCLSADFSGLYDRNGAPKFVTEDAAMPRRRRVVRNT